jgi:hypothetical protein
MAPRPINMPQPYAPRGVANPAASASVPGAPRVIRGGRGNDSPSTPTAALTPARAVAPLTIPSPESLGVGVKARTDAKTALSIPSPESLGVAVPSR